MDKDKIKDIVFRESGKDTKFTYDTEEMIQVVEAYIFIRKGLNVTVNLNKVTNHMTEVLGIHMQTQLQLLNNAFEDAQTYFFKNKDKLD